MRVKFRIVLLKGDKRLRKEDFKDKKDFLSLGMRYITEFKYLEATKWLLLAEDSWEKYILLGLINLALGQEEQAQEFLSQADNFERVSDIEIAIEQPEKGTFKRITTSQLPTL